MTKGLGLFCCCHDKIIETVLRWFTVLATVL